MNGFTLNIIISRKMYKNYTMAHMHRFRPVRHSFLIWVMAAALIVGCLAIQDAEAIMRTLGAILLVLAPVMVLTMTLVWYKAGLAYDSNAKIQQPITYIVSTESIRAAGKNYDSTYPWSEVVKIKKTDKFTAVYVTRVAALLFPTDQVSEEEIAFMEEQFRKVKP